ncbi:MAG: hypothetical protein AAF414_08835 [Pseudomonadota bacterium]
MRPLIPIFAMSFLVGACVTGGSDLVATDPNPEVAAASVAAEAQPQHFCYFLESETLTSGVRLTLGAGSHVLGRTYGTIHDEDAPYFAYYEQTHDGVLSGETISVTTITEIEYDVQTDQETWRFSPERLVRDDLTYRAADCAVIEAQFETENEN